MNKKKPIFGKSNGSHIYESVKIKKSVVDDVRRRITKTGQTISGFFTIAVEKELKDGRN